jgi:hypothetical protein
MVWDHEHGEPFTDVRSELVQQPVDFGLESRRDIVDRC